MKSFIGLENFQKQLGERGSKISGGQKRKLRARALYREKDIILLDEFTAHLISKMRK